jgi:queuine tRNA-ribosyltransferase
VRSDEEHPPHPTKQRRRKIPEARLGDYEVHTSLHGFSSIRQISSGEVMHSVNCPSDEANRLYVEQSCLSSRLAGPSASTDELVIWDVGLGAASNAMAVVHCFESRWKSVSPLRPLRLMSFERDLDSLKLAVRDPRRFPHLRHGAPHELLKNGLWIHSSGQLRWELLEGDFLKRFEEANAPDLIFYDPFSYKTDADFWTSAVFSRIFKRSSARPAELYTYSASTAVRVALLTAGFFVAEGVGMGPKSSTTIAFTTASGVCGHPLVPALLGKDWLARWRRSHSRVPAGLANEEIPAFEQRIETHPQFAIFGV